MKVLNGVSVYFFSSFTVSSFSLILGKIQMWTEWSISVKHRYFLLLCAFPLHIHTCIPSPPPEVSIVDVIAKSPDLNDAIPLRSWINPFWQSVCVKARAGQNQHFVRVGKHDTSCQNHSFHTLMAMRFDALQQLDMWARDINMMHKALWMLPYGCMEKMN